MSQASTLIIETSDLTRRFGDLTAVDRFTVSVQTGEIFGLLGPNGAGKSTVIKMLTTLLPPTSGRASVAGFSITSEASRVRRVIGYVPQMLSANGTSEYGLVTDFAILLVVSTILITICAWLYPRAAT